MIDNAYLLSTLMDKIVRSVYLPHEQYIRTCCTFFLVQSCFRAGSFTRISFGHGIVVLDKKLIVRRLWLKKILFRWLAVTLAQCKVIARLEPAVLSI